MGGAARRVARSNGGLLGRDASFSPSRRPLTTSNANSASVKVGSAKSALNRFQGWRLAFSLRTSST